MVITIESLVFIVHNKCMVNVLKANGEREPFSEEKLSHSMSRLGVPPDVQSHVITHLKKKVYKDIPTREIYGYVLDNLGRHASVETKAKYTLKQAIMLLGPTGYPFEDFVSALLQHEGYTTRVRQILMGKCVSHEVDVIAEKNKKKVMVEAKFHNNPGTRSDVHVTLYTKARFEDIKMKYQLDEAWVITNTKTTSDALAFAGCAGMKVISWSYPDGNSLRDLIDASGLHPITVLTTLSPYQKQQLLENHIVLCKELCANPRLLDLLHLPQERKVNVLEEVSVLCKDEHHFH
jgi:hypothetical protein